MGKTITFDSYAKSLGISKEKRKEVGLEISKTYRLIYDEKPLKVKRLQHKDGWFYWVNQYPIEFKVIIDNILKQHGLLK